MRLSGLRHLSLKTRVALAMALVFVGFAGALMQLGLRYFDKEYRNSLYEQQFSMVTTLASEVDNKLLAAHQMLIATAAEVSPSLLANSTQAQRFLDQQTALKAIFDHGLFFVSADGRVLADAPAMPGRRGHDVSDREFFQATVDSRKPYISKPFAAPHTAGRPVLMMTVPLLDAQGRLLGVFQGTLDLLGQNFLANLKQVTIGKTGYLFITDAERLMIVHPDARRILTLATPPGNNLMFDRAIDGFEGSGRTVTSRGHEMYASYKRLHAVNWILGANYPASEAEAPLRQGKTYFAIAVAASSVAVLLLVWLVMKYMMAPLAELTRQVLSLPGRKPDARQIDLQASGEISTLVAAFNTMVRELDRQQKTLRESEERFRSLAEMSTDWYWEQDADFRFTLVSQGLAKNNVSPTLGKTRWELPLIGVTPEQWKAHRVALQWHEPFRDFVYQVRDKDGGLRTLTISGAPIFDEQGVFKGYRGIGSDITDRKAAEQRIEYLAYHDTLTGLPNRLLVQDRFEQAAAQTDRSNTKVALVYLDLDNFKTINDTMGHAAGDALLKEVSRRLRECVRDTDTISRQGGDEFLLVLRDLPDTEIVSAIVIKIMERLQEPCLVENQELSTTVSIGVAICPDDGCDFETLRKKADLAMYRSKEAGRNAYHYFDRSMDAEAGEHLLMRNGLRHALERGEFVLHYQPQFDLASGVFTGVEALIRWQHPELGVIAPGRFISVAEESGLIVPMGDWVLKEACSQAVRWQQAGLPPLTVAVNLSAVQFRRGNVEQAVSRALAESGLQPSLLELELTESILIQNVESVLTALTRLKTLGVRLAIDDFGTGYSSLSYLKRFDIDKLKIDQSFVRDLASDPDDAAIVRAIIQMAHSLNLVTIAEGVETEDMRDRLIAFGCDLAQGYLYGRPMPADELFRVLSGTQAA